MSIRTLALTGLLLASAVTPVTTFPAAAEQAIPAEKNPPGDIPDTQVFVDYQGPGVTMKVPEGWARADVPGGATFSDKFNRIEVTSEPSSSALTAASVTDHEAKDLAASGRAVKIVTVKEVKLDGGKAVRVDYSANSSPNSVTNKQIRLEAVRFYLKGANGNVATLDMSAPFGADNVDQWNLMANSLRVK